MENQANADKLYWMTLFIEQRIEDLAQPRLSQEVWQRVMQAYLASPERAERPFAAFLEAFQQVNPKLRHVANTCALRFAITLIPGKARFEEVKPMQEVPGTQSGAGQPVPLQNQMSTGQQQQPASQPPQPAQSAPPDPFSDEVLEGKSQFVTVPDNKSIFVSFLSDEFNYEHRKWVDKQTGKPVIGRSNVQIESDDYTWMVDIVTGPPFFYVIEAAKPFPINQVTILRALKNVKTQNSGTLVNAVVGVTKTVSTSGGPNTYGVIYLGRRTTRQMAPEPAAPPQATIIPPPSQAPPAQPGQTLPLPAAPGQPAAQAKGMPGTFL
jgi:hypothetical protein